MVSCGIFWELLLRPGRRAQYRDVHACLFVNVSFVCVVVRLSVRHHTRPDFAKVFCVLPTAVTRSYFGGVAIRFVVPVIRTTSCLRAMAKNWRSEKGVYSKRHQAGSTDFTPRHIHEITHHRAAPSRGGVRYLWLISYANTTPWAEKNSFLFVCTRQKLVNFFTLGLRKVDL